MSAKRILFDARWVANHGIGRFAAEMAKSPLLNAQAQYLQGDFSSIFSPLDPLRLAAKLSGGGQWFVSPSYNGPAFCPSRTILTLHDLMHIRFSEYAGLKNRLYYQLLVRRACQRAPLIFTVSHFSKREICEWADVPPEKVAVVYNGVDEKYHPHVRPLVRERPYLFYIGDRKPHKNLNGILSGFAAAGLPEDIELLFSGQPHEEIVERATTLGIADRVSFSDFIPEQDLPSVYRGALAVMMPSFYEGFGLPMLEAMAVGTPVLAANCTAMPEIAEGGALLVDPDRIDDIANGMGEIVGQEGLRQRLIACGLQRAQTFTWRAARQSWDAALLSAGVAS